jgi:dTDP-glucose 4,6-dehydratase
MERKRILITGGAGFLGSHLCDRFIRGDYHVIAMDNLLPGDIKNIQRPRRRPGKNAGLL